MTAKTNRFALAVAAATFTSLLAGAASAASEHLANQATTGVLQGHLLGGPQGGVVVFPGHIPPPGQLGNANPPTHPCPLTSRSGCSGPPRPEPRPVGDNDHDHHHHHDFGYGYGYGYVEGVPAPVAVPVPAAAPAPAAVAQAPCTCLTKQTLANGSVLFQDICTKESAIAVPQTVGAR